MSSPFDKADAELSAFVTEQHVASRVFTHVAWTEDQIAIALEYYLLPNPVHDATIQRYDIDPASLLLDIPPDRQLDPLDDDVHIEAKTERAVMILHGIMYPAKQKGVREVLAAAGLRRKGGRKAYGGDPHPYPLSTHPVSPPVMTLKSERALPRIGELRGETLQRPEQLLEKKGTFGFVSKGRVNKVKEPVFDHDEVAGHTIEIHPHILTAARAWRQPLQRAFLRSHQAHRFPVEKMPRWAEWDTRSAIAIKEADMTPRMPLMPRERRNRPERHVFDTDLFPLPRMDAAALLADMKSSVAIEMAELDLCGETPWDGIEVPDGIAETTADPASRLFEIKAAQREATEALIQRNLRQFAYRRPGPTVPAHHMAAAQHHQARHYQQADEHQVYLPTGANADRYFYQHPISSPVTYHSGSYEHQTPDRMAPRRSYAGTPNHRLLRAVVSNSAVIQQDAHARHDPPEAASTSVPFSPARSGLMLPSRPDDRLPVAPGPTKRKKSEHTDDLRYLALRRKMARGPETSTKSAEIDKSGNSTGEEKFDARSHLDEQRYLRTGTLAPPRPAPSTLPKRPGELVEPELDEDEALQARTRKSIAEWEAAQKPPSPVIDTTPLTNPSWYAKACHVARSAGTTPLQVLASVDLFRNRPLVSALQTRQLDLLDEDAHMGGADLIPWATVGVLFRRLADVGDVKAYKAVVDSLKAAVVYYERVILVFEVKPYVDTAPEKDILRRMEDAKEDDHLLQSVREPNTPRKAIPISADTNTEEVEADVKASVPPAARQALSRLRRTAATIEGFNGMEKVASKVDIVFAHNGPGEVAGAIRAIAEYEEKRKMGKKGEKRDWLQVAQDGDEEAFINTFYVNPFAARLALDRYKPFSTFARESSKEEVEQKLDSVLGTKTAKRFAKILEEQKALSRQQSHRPPPPTQQDEGMYPDLQTLHEPPQDPYQDRQYPFVPAGLPPNPPLYPTFNAQQSGHVPQQESSHLHAYASYPPYPPYPRIPPLAPQYTHQAQMLHTYSLHGNRAAFNSPHALDAHSDRAGSSATNGT